jgi:hypothetical protein
MLDTRRPYGLAACGTLAEAVSYLSLAIWATIDAYLVAKRNN